MNSVEPPPMSMTTVGSEEAGAIVHRAEERELRLFLAGEHARVERELAPDPLGELGVRWRRRGRRR